MCVVCSVGVVTLSTAMAGAQIEYDESGGLVHSIHSTSTQHVAMVQLNIRALGLVTVCDYLQPCSDTIDNP